MFCPTRAPSYNVVSALERLENSGKGRKESVKEMREEKERREAGEEVRSERIAAAFLHWISESLSAPKNKGHGGGSVTSDCCLRVLCARVQFVLSSTTNNRKSEKLKKLPRVSGLLGMSN